MRNGCPGRIRGSIPPTRRNRSRPSFSTAVTMRPTSSMWAQSMTWGPFLEAPFPRPPFRRPERPPRAAGSIRATRLPMGSTSRESTLSRAYSARMARLDRLHTGVHVAAWNSDHRGRDARARDLDVHGVGAGAGGAGLHAVGHGERAGGALEIIQDQGMDVPTDGERRPAPQRNRIP